MKKLTFVLALAIALAFSFTASKASAQNYDPMSEADKIVVEMKSADKVIGNVVIVKTKFGLAFYPNLKTDAAQGIHGFHIHANADCGATDKGYAMKAGGHWDPKGTGMHSFPWDKNGHMGDLPSVYVNADGSINQPVLAPKLSKLNKIKGHALMIHFGGDNHSDNPKALGGGGARYACGVIE